MNVDTDGYTTSGSYQRPDYAENLPGFEFMWNRQTGDVGVSGYSLINSVFRKPDGQLKVQSRLDLPTGGFEVVSPTLPDGAHDVPQSPKWPTPNPKPKPANPSSGGGLTP